MVGLIPRGPSANWYGRAVASHARASHVPSPCSRPAPPCRLVAISTTLAHGTNYQQLLSSPLQLWLHGQDLFRPKKNYGLEFLLSNLQLKQAPSINYLPQILRFSMSAYSSTVIQCTSVSTRLKHACLVVYPAHHAITNITARFFPAASFQVIGISGCLVASHTSPQTSLTELIIWVLKVKKKSMAMFSLAWQSVAPKFFVTKQLITCHFHYSSC